MIMGAMGGFAAAVTTGSPVAGFVAGALAGAALALLFGVLTQVFLSNQTATGLALTLFGLGLSALFGKGYEGVRPPPTGKVPFGPLADLPVVGPILFGHDWVVYLSLVRIAALAFGGALAGLGGAYLSLVRVPQWTEGMTAGAGWIALAIVVFASWRAERVLIGAYLFGGITALQLQLQAAGYAIPVHFLSMAPYVITIIALVILSVLHRRGAQAAPADLGRSFHAAR